MIISRKKYEQAINDAVNEAFEKFNEKRRLEERFENIASFTDDRFTRLYARVDVIERAVFPEKFEVDAVSVKPTRGDSNE